MATLARPQQTPWLRDGVAAVPESVETLVHAFTVPGGVIWLDEVACTGTFAAVFTLYLDGTLLETKRMESAHGVAVFSFMPGRRLKRAAVIEVKVQHYDVGETHDYEATIKLHR